MYRKGERRILVVDDDAGIRSLLKNSLEVSGYQVETAQDGVEALRLWDAQTYGLIITDMVFMYSGGIDLVQSVRGRDAQVPILAITGYGEGVAQEALEAGANHVLLKPFHLFEVRQVVDRLLG
jgi:two-component system response regulator (stage 0 sporulation protein F)